MISHFLAKLLLNDCETSKFHKLVAPRPCQNSKTHSLKHVGNGCMATSWSWYLWQWDWKCLDSVRDVAWHNVHTVYSLLPFTGSACELQWLGTTITFLRVKRLKPPIVLQTQGQLVFLTRGSLFHTVYLDHCYYYIVNILFGRYSFIK